MSKLNERLTLIANLAVIVGIAFLAVEVRQTTRAIHSQTRDSIAEKEMLWAGWIATNLTTADVWVRGSADSNQLSAAEGAMYSLILAGRLREWENSHYQYEHGLFTPEEYEARVRRWQASMLRPGYRTYWAGSREAFAPSFRAEIDRIVAESTNQASN